MENKEQVITYIKTIDELGADKQNAMVAMVEDGKNINDVFDIIENTLQSDIDDTFNSEGIELDENSEEYKNEHKKMMDEMELANNEFGQTMKEIEKEIELMEVSASEELDQIKISDLQNKISE